MSMGPIVILGGGPAGLSAGLWLKNLGLAAVVLERQSQPGGMQNLNFLDNNWILGQAGVTGQELGRRFRDHARSAGVDIRLNVTVTGLAPGPGRSIELELDNGHPLSCTALVIATGTRFNGLEVLGDILSRIPPLGPKQAVCGPYAFQDLAAQAGRHVVIVGGGDNAYENARLLLDVGATVTVVIRSRPRAQQQMLAAVTNRHGCTTLQDSRISAVAATPLGLNLELQTPWGKEMVAADRLHILAGYRPNTDFLVDLLPNAWQPLLRRDAAGYLTVDAWGRTDIAGVYAIGDVCNPDFPSVVSALAQGAKTAKAIERDLRESPSNVPLFSCK